MAINKTTLYSTGLGESVSDGKGGLLVNGSVIYVDTIADLQALPTSELVGGQHLNVTGYHVGSDLGGGVFYWDAARPKGDHNGGTVISNTVPWDGQQSSLPDYLSGVGESDPSGQGVLVRIGSDVVSLEDFGAVSGGEAAFILNAISATKASKVRAQSSSYILSDRVDFSDQENLDIDFGGASLELNLTSIVTNQGVADSLDYALYVDGLTNFSLHDAEITFGTVSNYSGIHRTIGVSEVSGDIGTDFVKIYNIRVNGGFAPDSAGGSVFINNKISKTFELFNILYDNATYPTGFTKAYRVFCNCELREPTGSPSGIYPESVWYHDIEMRNNNSSDSDGLLRIAGAQKAVAERITAINIYKPIKMRMQDNIGEVNGFPSECIGVVRDSKFVDFGTWAINADTLNNQSFGPYSLLVDNCVFEILADTYSAEDHFGVYLLPIHNVGITNCSFKNLDSDLRLRTYSSGESLPRGSDKTFSGLSFTRNKSSGCKDRAITANDFSANYSGYGTVIGMLVCENQFKGGSAAEAYLHIEELERCVISGNIFGVPGVSQPSRAVNIGSTNLSKNTSVCGNKVYGVYGAAPFVYSSSANQYLGNNLIYDNEFGREIASPYAFAVARPYGHVREWFSPQNSAPSSAQAESAEMVAGEAIVGDVDAGGTVFNRWFVTDTTAGAYVVKSGTVSLT